MHENPKYITAKWTTLPAVDADYNELERLIRLAEEVSYESLTEEEQADLIVEKLKRAPKKFTTEDELLRIISEKIAKEIDAEIMQRMLDAQSEYRRNVK